MLTNVRRNLKKILIKKKITLTRSKLSPVILIVCPPVTTVYLYSPKLASFVLKLCSNALEVRVDCGNGFSSDAEELILELEPVNGPVILCSRTGEALRFIVSSISCFA